MRGMLLIGLCLALAGCSKPEAHKLGHDVRTVGADISADIHGAARNPDLKAAGQDLKDAGHDTAQAARQAAQGVAPDAGRSRNDQDSGQ